ncbi:MAG TPA: polysaccharide biosynthesis/export family protein [Candidatus Xenobia bacterium]|nr:polysaccharide biosynthesis/export family protein [Candidatus Xenobia bacterium]
MARTILAPVLSFLLTAALLLPAQEPTAPAAAPPAKPAGTYVIGPGDLLSITVYDAPDLSRDVRVSASGVILMPLIPQPVQADGLTPEELALSLAREFEERQILRNPQVTVLVKEYKSRPVAVLGAVRKPQMIPVYGPITLLEVLSAAEGLTDDAGPLIYVVRNAALRELPANVETPQPDPANPRVVVIKTRELMDAKDPAVNIPVYAGDMVTVPRGGIVYVVGAVKRPGGFVLKDRHEQVSVLQALALAEYVTPTAKPDKAVIVRRTPGSDSEETIPVDVSRILARKADDVPLQENDILFIPDSQFKRGMRRVAEAAIQLTTGILIWGVAAR